MCGRCCDILGKKYTGIVWRIIKYVKTATNAESGVHSGFSML